MTSHFSDDVGRKKPTASRQHNNVKKTILYKSSSLKSKF